MRIRRAFTLIELITVLAIASMLLALIIIPLVQSFNFTRAAQAFADAQERGRLLIASITREISNGSGVRDNEGDKGSVAVVVPGLNGARETVILPNSKLDIVLPAQGDPSSRGVGGAFIDPDTGRADPTLEAPKGQMLLPTAPGMQVVRYYVSLLQPLAANGVDPGTYNNPYDGVLMQQGGGRDNLYVLRRATFVPIRNNGGTLQVNTDLFVDANTDGVPDDMDDPFFMVQDPPGQAALPQAEREAKAQRIKNWLAKSTVVTEFSRYDMIQPVIDRATGAPVYDGNIPQVFGLVQFSPDPVTNEPATGQTVLKPGDETDSPENLAADVYRTEKGSWSSPVIRVFPSGYNPSDANRNGYLVCRYDSRAGTRRGKVFAYDPDDDPDKDDRNGEDDPADDFLVYDIGVYEEWTEKGFTYPFTRALTASYTAPNTDWQSVPEIRNLFVPFFTDPRAGKVHTSFGIDAVGLDDAAGTPATTRNLPTKDTGTAVTPVTAGALPGNFYDYDEVNSQFNKIWNDRPELRPNIHRFIDLRVAQNADGAYSPLYPNTGTAPERGFPHARIVPGTEQVFGPDQNPGPNYGERIRYTRTTRTPGANQYRINYVDQPEPTDYALLGFPAAEVATFNALNGNYDSTNFLSAVIQPRYKAGYLWLNSDPNLPLPEGQIEVYYKFQFARPGDTITVDYDTRQLMSVSLTIRNYPQADMSPQSITLQGSAAVRNFMR